MYLCKQITSKNRNKESDSFNNFREVWLENFTDLDCSGFFIYVYIIQGQIMFWYKWQRPNTTREGKEYNHAYLERSCYMYNVCEIALCAYHN